ncbi:hypothetical protein CENA302_09695 [Cylindrospermopsis raciborskii CENA302]|uniref:Uncharacterized protein n=1 Tax=Cylindrospermopsis raciborskii CENA302 TaxID=1170768 RepID=A0A9Q5W932_9CYAN|nr:hypothetical protein CENA302_09695 [Cylindrospermopsis raciborskii CENA302]
MVFSFYGLNLSALNFGDFSCDHKRDARAKIANQRAHKLWESHQRVRKITKEIPVTVEPRIPMDLLGVYILHPS